MAQVHLTAKDAWRQLRSEGVTSVGYQGFCKWLDKLAIEPKSGIDADALNTLRRYAQVRSASPCRTHQNGANKSAALKALTSLPIISGSQIVDIAETYRALSKATIYRRAQKLLDRKFSADTVYSKTDVRKLIYGV